MAGMCLVMGLAPGWFFPVLARAAAAAAPLLQMDFHTVVRDGGLLVSNIGLLSGIFLVLVTFLFVVRRDALLGKEVAQSSTWGCGYSVVIARAQYTASSFAQFPVSLFRSLVDRRVESHKPEGYFPAGARFRSSAPDLILNRVVDPLVEQSLAWMSTFRRLQHGKVQLYLLYMFVALVALFVWKL
jgi:hypothetical protein